MSPEPEMPVTIGVRASWRVRELPIPLGLGMPWSFSFIPVGDDVQSKGFELLLRLRVIMLATGCMCDGMEGKVEGRRLVQVGKDRCRSQCRPWE
jgi:hypothetical protein